MCKNSRKYNKRRKIQHRYERIRSPLAKPDQILLVLGGGVGGRREQKLEVSGSRRRLAVDSIQSRKEDGIPRPGSMGAMTSIFQVEP